MLSETVTPASIAMEIKQLKMQHEAELRSIYDAHAIEYHDNAKLLYESLEPGQYDADNARVSYLPIRHISARSHGCLRSCTETTFKNPLYVFPQEAVGCRNRSLQNGTPKADIASSEANGDYRKGGSRERSK